ncbi:hypothetical protein AY608_08355 [Acinetobacter terrae]|nr:hypothetical protein AY608_08355 [Acinetobacter terrae]
MVYFASVNCWISIQNNLQKLAVVSAPPKVFLVLYPCFPKHGFFYLEKNISDFLKSIICIQIDEYDFYAETIEFERALSVKKDKSNG